EGQFMALAAQAMRRILVDHARKQKRLKHGQNPLIITHKEDVVFFETTPEDMLALHEALTRLETLNQRQAKVVENWFFGGFSHKEIAKILNTSLPTVRRDWRLARLWLSKELKREVGM
ncbi:MAG: sigma-70 family RNA polymerase sigma factor, partial [Bacteroidota bacterium]